MTDWYENMDTNVKWIVRKASSTEELAKLSEGLENDGWEIRTISIDHLSILASKKNELSKAERLDD